MPRRQMVALEVILSVDADKAAELVGTEGWMDALGEGEPPIPGIVYYADRLVWGLASRALSEWRDTLDAVIVEATGIPGDIEDEDKSDF